MMNKSIVITGANGFVGSRLSSHFEKLGLDCRKVVRESHAVIDAKYTIPIIDGSTDWKDILEGAEVVVHTAARVHMMKEVSDAHELYYQTNVEGTVALAKQAVTAGVKKFIYISSIKVNGEETTGTPFTEDVQNPPQDPYGSSKYHSEQQLLEVVQDSNMKVVIIRPPLMYGPGVKANFLQLIKMVDKGVPLPLGAIRNCRSLLCVDNLVDFIHTCIITELNKSETFLLSDMDDVSTTRIVKAIRKSLHSSTLIVPVPMKILQILFTLIRRPAFYSKLCGNLQIDSRKAQKVLSWEPPLSFEEGLEGVIEEYTLRSDS